jgi:hypothetical protein
MNIDPSLGLNENIKEQDTNNKIKSSNLNKTNKIYNNNQLIPIGQDFKLSENKIDTKKIIFKDFFAKAESSSVFFKMLFDKINDLQNKNITK